MAEERSEFEVTELEDEDLEDVSGGVARGNNTECPTNSGNCAALCGCPPE